MKEKLYLTLNHYTENEECRTMLTVIRNITWMLVVFACADITLSGTIAMVFDGNNFRYAICKLWCVFIVALFNSCHYSAIIQLKVLSVCMIIHDTIFVNHPIGMVSFITNQREKSISLKNKKIVFCICMVNFALFVILNTFVVPTIKDFYISLVINLISTTNLLLMQSGFVESLICFVTRKRG